MEKKKNPRKTDLNFMKYKCFENKENKVKTLKIKIKKTKNNDTRKYS